MGTHCNLYRKLLDFRFQTKDNESISKACTLQDFQTRITVLVIHEQNMEFLYILNLLAAIIASVVLICKRHWILAFVAVCATAIYAYGIIHSGVPQMTELANMLYFEERYTEAKAIASVYGSIASLIMTSIMMSLFPWIKRWALFLWLVLFLIIGMITGIMSPLGITEGTYGICCAIMTMLAQMFGITYMAACYIENIYIHSLLPTLFAIPAAYVGLRNIVLNKKDCVAALFAITHLTTNAIMTILIWNHYIHLTMHEATDLCVRELQTIGKVIAPGWSGYVAINLIIFVVIFLVDAFLSWALYRWNKSHKLENSNSRQ